MGAGKESRYFVGLRSHLFPLPGGHDAADEVVGDVVGEESFDGAQGLGAAHPSDGGSHLLLYIAGHDGVHIHHARRNEPGQMPVNGALLQPPMGSDLGGGHPLGEEFPRVGHRSPGLTLLLPPPGDLRPMLAGQAQGDGFPPGQRPPPLRGQPHHRKLPAYHFQQPSPHQLSDEPLYLLQGQIGQAAVIGRAVVAPGDDLLRTGAFEDLRHFLPPHGPGQAAHRVQDPQGDAGFLGEGFQGRPVNRGGHRVRSTAQAIVAASWGLGWTLVTEVGQDESATAPVGFGVGHHAGQLSSLVGATGLHLGRRHPEPLGPPAPHLQPQPPPLVSQPVQRLHLLQEAQPHPQLHLPYPRGQRQVVQGQHGHFPSLRLAHRTVEGLQFPGRRGVVLDEPLLQGPVLRGVEEHTFGGVSIPARPSGLLIIGLQGAGEGEVEHEAHVGPVHPHPEGVGGHDQVQPAGHETVLDGCSEGVFHPGVIGPRLPPHHLPHEIGHLLRLPPGAHVDDARAVVPGQELPQRPQFVGKVRGVTDTEGEVRAVEAGDDAFDSGKAQEAHDVVLDLGGGGGGEGYGGGFAHLLSGGGDVEVIGAEVVAPLGDAVGLVYRQQADMGLA